ncbi:hypothetical protein D3C71_2091080 [compost metagenome]
MVLFDNLDDRRTGYRPGSPGLQRITYLGRLRDTKALQRWRRMVFTQFVHQMMQRQLGAAFGSGYTCT